MSQAYWYWFLVYFSFLENEFYFFSVAFSWQILSEFHLRRLEVWLILLMYIVYSTALEAQVYNASCTFFSSKVWFLRYWFYIWICRRWKTFTYLLFDAELISPEDLLRACSLWEKFDVYVRHSTYLFEIIAIIERTLF